MTLALALATDRTRVGVAITLIDDLPLMVVILTVLVLLLAGLVIDLGAGLVIGTATLWPAVISVGIVLGLLSHEVLKGAYYNEASL